ncbi:LacI family transcriptional regulator [Anaerocolumna cellulosilytica]|uniref:LacI family transcriptional regulator n=1 Tax=Anaerocolumna cellulosilytica TaxID=433286 RepID=A0A6S6R1P1_9FIRM|nr:LacI family DNA-binding transcriptional regulator [Anaerocolumna cellulosilytica]MBB5195747.1 LacI family transcriptional regulator [Anaerocolumna cellulosilytica]BCJ92918.1 LacI family transcriptional regulator [Anaerocolumna cellulosilytica]
MAVTIRQIAEISGVSRGTVDRVLNNRGRVNPATEKLVRKVADELGYQPNVAGKALAAIKKNFIIGIILSSEGNAFFDDVIAGIRQAEKEAASYGIQVVLKTMKGYDASVQLSLIRELKANIHTLILQPINDESVVQEINSLSEQDIPVITLNNDIHNSRRLCYVGSDYFKSGETACGCLGLLTRGKANIGIVTGSVKILGHNQRILGFNSILERKYMDFYVADIIETNDDDQQGYTQTLKMLENHPEINALYIVAAGAVGVCKAVTELGKEMAIDIVACDTTPAVKELIQQGLIKATICQQPYVQGYQSLTLAVEFLIHGAIPKQEYYIINSEIKIPENL